MTVVAVATIDLLKVGVKDVVVVVVVAVVVVVVAAAAVAGMAYLQLLNVVFDVAVGLMD